MLEIILTLARLFRAQGKQLYTVGGTVRDALLHRDTTPDVDMTTDAHPDEIKRLVARTRPVAVVTVGEQFGTVRIHYQRTATGSAAESVAPPARAPVAAVASASADADVIEITTYRSDRYDADSRKPEVTFGDTLEGDLLRRDFTINAMARDPLSGEIVDPFGGRADLERRLIRAVGNEPARRFDEDPLRMLRAARFAAQFDFTIEPATAAAIERQADTLRKISRERIRDDFTKLLMTAHPALGLRLLVTLGLMPYIVPEVMELRGVTQRPAHSKDVYDHVLRVVERIPARPAARWAALLHDIGKPRTRSVENGHVHFFGHEDVGAAMTRDVLRQLKFDKPFIEHVRKLVSMHMRADAYAPDWTDGAVRRLMLDAGDTLPDLLDLSRADITSYRQEKVARAQARVDELAARCRWLREEAERVPLKSPLDGNDLMALFGRGPGPWLRPIKDYLLDLVLDGQLAPDDREAAAAAARRFLAEREQPEHTSVTPAAVPPVAPIRDGDADHPTAPAEEQATMRQRTRQSRAAARRQSRAAVQPGADTSAPPPATLQIAPRRRDSNPTARAAHQTDAARDEIVRFLDEYLEIARFKDLGPNGMQVIGKPEVRCVVLGVSANLALFEAAIAARADMIVVHHGLFLDRDPRPILARMKRRLQALFSAEITLLGYHLPLDAHPVAGNNVQWLNRLGFTLESTAFAPFQGQHIGAIGVREEPVPFAALVRHVAELAGDPPRVYAFGPAQVRRLAVATGDAPGSLAEAVERGCDALLTGEVAEGTQALAREAEANFIAAGHYDTERFGVQALGALLRERFAVETRFIDVPNAV